MIHLIKSPFPMIMLFLAHCTNPCHDMGCAGGTNFQMVIKDNLGNNLLKEPNAELCQEIRVLSTFTHKDGRILADTLHSHQPCVLGLLSLHIGHIDQVLVISYPDLSTDTLTFNGTLNDDHCCLFISEFNAYANGKLICANCTSSDTVTLIY